jgi:RNA polymerase sigma factor (sigma-70 family)
MDDPEVMTLIREGRIEMLAILFERHQIHLFNFFLRLTGQRGMSEDLVQEVFLRVLKYRGSYRAGAPFQPWLFQIARNAHWKHLKGIRPDLSVEDHAVEAADPSEGPLGHLENRSDLAQLGQALLRLPARKREVLLLSRNPDLSYQDLADQFECTVGAVKVQVHRALKDLRKSFLELQGGSA